MTWVAIAKKHGMGEREVRVAYQRYVTEIRPLMSPSTPAATVSGYLDELRSIRRELRQIASSADNDSAKVGALREIVKTIGKEIELQQHLGMLPRNLGEIRLQWEHRWVVQQIVEVLQRFDVPADALSQLENVLSAPRPEDGNA